LPWGDRRTAWRARSIIDGGLDGHLRATGRNEVAHLFRRRSSAGFAGAIESWGGGFGRGAKPPAEWN
jgi:hypothetical protein